MRLPTDRGGKYAVSFLYFQLYSMKQNQHRVSDYSKGKLEVRVYYTTHHIFFLTDIYVILFRVSFYSDIWCLIYTAESLTQNSWQCGSHLHDMSLRHTLLCMAPFQPCWAQWHQTAHQSCMSAILNRDFTKKSTELQRM